MRRRAVTALATIAVATATLGVPSANPATLDQLINQNFRWNFNDDSAEFKNVGRFDQAGTLDLTLNVGDTLRGVISVGEFIAQPDGPAFPLDGVNNSAVHGLFEMEITSKVLAPAVPGAPERYFFHFGPHLSFADELVNYVQPGQPEPSFEGAMIALWESGTPLQPKDPSPGNCDTIANCEALATAGDLRLVLGFDNDLERDNVWSTGPIGEDLADAADFALGATFGTFDYRINVLWDDLDVPPFIDVEGRSLIGTDFFDGPAHAVGWGLNQGIAGMNTPYDAFNQASITMAVVPVPAALPLFLAGLGALGLIGWRRNVAWR